MTDHKDWVEQGARLRMARLRRGYGTKGSLAAAMGLNPNTYRSHESGTRGLDKFASQYAEFLNVTVEWLLFGHGSLGGDASSRPEEAPRDRPPVAQPAFGREAAFTRHVQDFNVLLVDNFEGRALWAEQSIRLPAGVPKVTAAFKVQGNALRPAYDDGNILMFWNRETEPSRCIGTDCAVCLSNGQLVLARLERGGSDDSWDLLGVSASARLHKDAKIKWAAAIEMVIRSEHWNLPLLPPIAEPDGSKARS